MSEKRGRHELKHRINYADFLEIRTRLPFVAAPDKNAPDGGSYRVRSLYFDNYDDKALHEKIDGVNDREKFRLRLYNGNPFFIRLEKKSKKNGLSYKSSAAISAEECASLLEGDADFLKQSGDPPMLELYAKMKYQRLKPKNIVDYRREAYIFKAGNVRVTLDSDIRTGFDVKRFLDREITTVPIPGTILLEVKYDAYLPEIIRGLVTLTGRQNSAFSKYAFARIL